jgi:hypothetical protein
LEKQQQLNEKLENDLLEIEKHQQTPINGKLEGRDAPKNSGSSDALAGIELGKKPSVCVSLLGSDYEYSFKRFVSRLRRRGTPQYHSRQIPQMRPSCLS